MLCHTSKTAGKVSILYADFYFSFYLLIFIERRSDLTSMSCARAKSDGFCSIGNVVVLESGYNKQHMFTFQS